MKKILLAAFGLILGASVAFASGVFVNGMNIVTPLSGVEQFGVDTQIPQGATPQSGAVTIGTVQQGTNVTATNATSFTGTAPQESGAARINLLLTGAPTTGQTMTTATASAIVANIQTTLPAAAAQSTYSYLLHIVNVGGTSSGAWTVAGGTGVTITGNATIAVAGSRTYLVTVTSFSTPAVTFQDLGN